MKKKVIDEASTKRQKRTNEIIEFLLYLIGYAFVIVLVSLLFPSVIKLDYGMHGLWAIIVVLVLVVLNKMLKPLLLVTTFPLMIFTSGIFYLFINVILLQLTDLILGKHLEVNGIFGPLLIALFISFLNTIIDKKIIKPLLEKRR